MLTAAPPPPRADQLARLMTQARGALIGSDTAPELHVLGALLNRNRDSTATEYARDLRGFASWCQAQELPLFQVSRLDVERWRRELEEQGYRSRTIRRRLASLQGFYLEAQDQGLVERVPTLRVKRPRVDEEQVLGLDREDCRRLLAAAHVAGARDEALICLLLLNGLRVTEAVSLRVHDLDQQRGHRVIRFLRKGDKRRTVPLAPRTARAIDAQLEQRRPLDGSAPLIARADGSALDRHAAARITRRLGRRAGLRSPLHPHELRHAFITLALDAGVSLRDTQEAAGHSDPKTTIGYDRGRHALDRHATYAVAAHLG